MVTHFRDQADDLPESERYGNMAGKTLSGRVLTSLCSLSAFVVAGLSGLILYLVPQGRIAYWTDWRLWGLGKTQWTDIHIIASIVFLVTAGFHIYFNWKPLTNYLGSKAAGMLRYRRELAASLVLGLWMVASGILALPPLSYLSVLSDTIKAAWVTSPEYEPPYGHAELLSLKVFCDRLGIPLDRALAQLKAQGYELAAPSRSLKEIAAARGVSPLELYRVIKKFEPKPEPLPPAHQWTAEEVEHRFAGTSMGRKPFKLLLRELNLDAALARRRLARLGVDIADQESLKDVAARTGRNPLQLMKVMLEAR